MITLTKKLEADAQTLAWYICGSDLDSVVEQAAYDNSQEPSQHTLDCLMVIQRAIEINDGNS